MTASLEMSDSSKTHSSSSSNVSSAPPGLMMRPPSSTTPPPRSTSTFVPASVSTSATFTDPFGVAATLTSWRPVVVRIIERSTLEPFGRAISTAPRFLSSFFCCRARFVSAFFAFSSNLRSRRDISCGRAISSSSSKSSHSSCSAWAGSDGSSKSSHSSSGSLGCSATVE